MTASAFRWLLLPELGLALSGVVWAYLAEEQLVFDPSPRVVLAAIGLTLGFTALNFGLYFAGRRLERVRSVYSFLEGEIFPLVQEASLLELLAGAALAGFAEELLFRGLLQPRIGLAAASVVFGLLHGPSRNLWPLAVWAGGAGLLLGLVYSATGNLLLPMMVHALYDAVALLYVRYYWRPRRLDQPSPGI